MQELVETGFGGIKPIVQSLWRRRNIAMSVAGVAFCILTAVVVNLTPQYTADALLILATKPAAELGGSEAQRTATSDSLLVRTEPEVLTSDSLSNEVIEQLRLHERRDFIPEPGLISSVIASVGDLTRAVFGAEDNEAAQEMSGAGESRYRSGVLDFYKSRLSIVSSGRSTAVRVAFTSEDPKIAAEIANAHAEAYLRQQARRRIAAQTESLQWLRSELDARANELRTAEAAVQAFRSEKGLIEAQKQNQHISIIDQELLQLSEQLTTARGEVAKSASRLRQISAPDGEVLQGTTDMSNSPVLLKLREREAEAETALARARSLPNQTSSSNIAILELQSVREGIKKEMERIRNSAASDLEAASQNVMMLKGEIERTKSAKRKFDEASAELRTLEAIVASKRTVYDAVLTRFNILLAKQRFEGADAELVSAALVPIHPAFPRTKLFLLLAFCFCVGLGSASGIAVDYLRPGMLDPTQIARALQVRVLAVVPLVNAMGDGVTNSTWSDFFWDRIRSIRLTIPKVDTEAGLVILVTSPEPEDGTSLIAASLAQSISALDMETVLVDGDLRNPTILSNFRDSPELQEERVTTSLNDVLAQGLHVNEAILRARNDHLAVLPSVPGKPDIIDALSTSRMHRVIADLRERFRVVIINSPPVGAVSDAVALASLADCALVVARSPRDLNGPLSLTLNRLREHGIDITGIVLTSSDKEDFGDMPRIWNAWSAAEKLRVGRRAEQMEPAAHSDASTIREADARVGETVRELVSLRLLPTPPDEGYSPVPSRPRLEGTRTVIKNTAHS